MENGHVDRKLFAIGRKTIIMKYGFSDTTYMTKGFNKILKEALGDSNLSELSRKLKISRSLLQDWIHNGREPSFKNIEHIKKLADYLGITLDEILVGKTNNKVISSVEFQDEGKRYQILIHRIK